LLVAGTGAGKTLAGFLPTICDLAEQPAEGLHSLYISPLKALAVDVQRNLLDPIGEMGCRSGSRRAPATRRPIRKAPAAR
jgi:ATP-dependent Lhr-like helicase